MKSPLVCSMMSPFGRLYLRINLPGDLRKRFIFLSFFDRNRRLNAPQCQLQASPLAIPQVAEFYLYLREDLGLSVATVKGYREALNHVFSLAGMDLAPNPVV